MSAENKQMTPNEVLAKIQEANHAIVDVTNWLRDGGYQHNNRLSQEHPNLAVALFYLEENYAWAEHTFDVIDFIPKQKAPVTKVHKKPIKPSIYERIRYFINW